VYVFEPKSINLRSLFFCWRLSKRIQLRATICLLVDFSTTSLNSTSAGGNSSNLNLGFKGFSNILLHSLHCPMKRSICSSFSASTHSPHCVALCVCDCLCDNLLRRMCFVQCAPDVIYIVPTYPSLSLS